MIRMSRVLIFYQKFWEVPILFNQRTACPRKPIFVKFSVVTEEEKPKPLDSCQTNVRPYEEVKYIFLKKIFNGGAGKDHGFVKMQSTLREFFNNLPNISGYEIIKVFELLSSSKNRPIASIKTLCSLFHTKKWDFTALDCCSLLHSLSKLSYRDQGVIHVIAETLKGLNDLHSPKVVSLIMYSLGDLKFRDPELMDKLFKYVLSSHQTVKITLNCLRSACLLNYKSPEVDQFIKNLSSLKPTDFAQSIDYINFVWACFILNKQNYLTNEQISAVLTDSFITMLLNNGMFSSTKWKLLNINGVAKEMTMYSGPLLNDTSNYKILSLSLPKPKSFFLESVLDTLSYIVTPSAHLKPLVNTGAGFYLDFEFCDVSEESTIVNKDPPKIGLMLLNFNDICSDDTLSGLTVFKMNVLKSHGLKVTSLSHSEYHSYDPLGQKIKLLRRKISEVSSCNAFK